MNLFNPNLVLLLIDGIITISAAYAAWVNLVQKEISKFGFDAFILLFFSKERVKYIRKSPDYIKRMGIITLLIAIGGASEVYSALSERFLPFLK